MKRRLLDLHLYLGLLCAPYLVGYGISAISFNHDWVGTRWTSERLVVAAFPARSVRRLEEGTWLGTVWGLYTELSVWVLVFAVASGIYLWSSRSNLLGWTLGLSLEPAPEATDAASERAIQLRDSLDIPGRLREVRPEGAGWRAKFASASQRTQLSWLPASDEVQLEIRPASFGPSFTTLHRIHGAHGGPAYLLFAVLVDLVGVAMIVYAITGVILWWKIKRKKRLGLGLLGAGTALTLVWMSLLAWGP